MKQTFTKKNTGTKTILTKHIMLICLVAFANIITLNAQCVGNVTIPNAIFKNYLVTNTLINTNSDAEIQCSEAAAFAVTIYVSGLIITDLTGIEAFTALKRLYCQSNLTTPTVASNAALHCHLLGRAKSLQQQLQILCI